MRDGKQVTRDGHKEIQEGTERTTISWKIEFYKEKETKKFREPEGRQERESNFKWNRHNSYLYTLHIIWYVYNYTYLVPNTYMLGQGKLKLNSPQDMKMTCESGFWIGNFNNFQFEKINMFYTYTIIIA